MLQPGAYDPRFMKPAEPCWIWLGTRNSSGYGTLRFHGRRMVAHRAMWELFRGPIPEGFTLDHLCRNRACVNPAHLEPVTMRENLRRGNGWSGRHAQQTHCKHGHEFTAENTYQRRGRRECRACRNAAFWREYRRKRREEGRPCR